MATLFGLYDDVIRAIIDEIGDARYVLRFARTCKRFRALVDKLWPEMVSRAKYWSSCDSGRQTFEFYEFSVVIMGPKWAHLYATQDRAENIKYKQENHEYGSEYKIRIDLDYKRYCQLFYVSIWYDCHMQIVSINSSGKTKKLLPLINDTLAQAKIAPEIIRLLRAAIWPD